MRILYVEPFETGSHARFTQTLTTGLSADWSVITLPGRHWKWRMRGSAVYAARARSEILQAAHDVLLCSSYLPLADLLALVPRLQRLPKLLYFHENQLAYPVRNPAERDHHFGFTQMVSALCADQCVFNSAYNRDSFLQGGTSLLARMPDATVPGWIEEIEARSTVLPVPLDLPGHAPRLDPPTRQERASGPILLWNHRWEYDKDPESFFAALRVLVDEGVPFRVAVCGQRFAAVPAVFEEARRWLGERVVAFGHLPRDEYDNVLSRSHVVVSTAKHEFFGIAVLEAVHHGARPLVPDRLAYVEHIPSQYRYRDGELVPTLRGLCRSFVEGELPLRDDYREVTAPFAAKNVLPRYASLLSSLASKKD